MTDLTATPTGSAGSQMPLIGAAILFASGCALFGQQAGQGLFGAAYEILRARDQDAVLDSPAIFEASQYAGWIAGLALGAFLFWTWHSADRTLAGPSRTATIKRWTVLALGAAGAAQIGYLIGTNNPMPVEIVRPGTMMAVSTLAIFIAGCVLLTRYYGAGYSTLARVGRGALTSAAAVAVILFWLALNKNTHNTYGSLGEERSVWMEIMFPPGAYAPDKAPDPKQIAVELRTPEGAVRGFASEWLDHGTQMSLRANLDLKVRNRDRVVTLTPPGEQALSFRMPFPANPAPTGNYDAWRRIDFVSETPPPGKRAEYRIRYRPH